MNHHRPGGTADLVEYIIDMNGPNTFSGANSLAVSEELERMLSSAGMTGLIVKSFYQRLFDKNLDWSISGGDLKSSSNYMAAMRNEITRESCSGYIVVHREDVDGKLVPSGINLGATSVEGANMVQFTFSKYGLANLTQIVENADMKGVWVFARSAVLNRKGDDDFIGLDDGYLYILDKSGEYINVERTNSIMASRPEAVIGTVGVDEFVEAIVSKDDDKLVACSFQSFQKSASDIRGKI